MNYNLVKKDSILVPNIRLASNLRDRVIGLMFSKSLGHFGGLLITPCNSIHTFFMNYSLDVIFFSKNNKVIKIIREIKPWRMTPIYFGSCKVLEVMGGTLSEKINEGDVLDFICIS